jgi:hypothetical protein
MAKNYDKPTYVPPVKIIAQKPLPSTVTRTPTPSPYNQNPSSGGVTSTNENTGGN